METLDRVGLDLGAVVCSVGLPVIDDPDAEGFAKLAESFGRHLGQIQANDGQVVQLGLGGGGQGLWRVGVQSGSFVLLGAALDLEVVVALAQPGGEGVTGIGVLGLA